MLVSIEEDFTAKVIDRFFTFTETKDLELRKKAINFLIQDQFLFYNHIRIKQNHGIISKITLDYRIRIHSTRDRLSKLQKMFSGLINVKGSIYPRSKKPPKYLQYCSRELMDILEFCGSPLYNLLRDRDLYCRSFIGKEMTDKVLTDRLTEFTATYFQE